MCRCFLCPLSENVTRSSFVILLRAHRMSREGELEVKTQKLVRADKRGLFVTFIFLYFLGGGGFILNRRMSSY